MVTQVTQGIAVSVETFYQGDYSRPLDGSFTFSYQITIDNQTDHSIQVMSRHWHIVDSNSEYREVRGVGIVGKQPIIEPGEKHTYVSGCQLKTGIGKMFGTYEVFRHIDREKLIIEIPEFLLVAPLRMN